MLHAASSVVRSEESNGKAARAFCPLSRGRMTTRCGPGLGLWWFLGATLVAAPLRAQLVQSDRDAILNAHDVERCAVEPPARRMPALVWDVRLERVAQGHASRCALVHNASRSSDYAALGGSGPVGENMAQGSVSAATLVGLWAAEKPGYAYGPLDSKNVARTSHYTQMIWAGTRAIGCGFASCFGAWLLVCNYAPAGNILGLAPYVSGSGTNEACRGPARGGADPGLPPKARPLRPGTAGSCR